MQPQITSNTIVSDEPSDTSRPISTTHYIAHQANKADALSDVTRSIVVHTYSTSEDVTLTLTPQTPDSITALQSLLGTAGFDTTLKDTDFAQKTLKLVPRTKFKEPAAAALAMTLGKAPARNGGIGENFASQIMGAELKRTGVSASQAGLLQLEVKDLPATHITRHRKDPRYLDADITHPFSPVTYLSERSNTPTGREAVLMTRIGFRDGKDATRIKKALEGAGVLFTAPLGSTGESLDIIAQAPISEVAGALSQRHVLPEAIADEIQTKAISMKAEQRIGGGASPSQGAAR